MWRGMAGVALVALAAAGGTTVSAQGGAPAVRPEDPGIRALIARGTAGSATFRDLATRLENADVIVYVRFAPCTGGVPACLLWTWPGSGRRRLLIRLDKFGRSPDELTVLLAHELHHVHEVASAPEVTDLASFEKFFSARGWKNRQGFETREAKDIARRVDAELRLCPR